MTAHGRVDGKRDVVLAGHSGDTATARRALDAGNAEIRAAALNALARCHALTPASLRSALDDTSPIVRRRCAVLLSRERPEIDDATRASMIDCLMHDIDDSVVETACFAAGELADAPSGVVAALVRIGTERADPLCRESAVAALGSIGDPGGFDAVAAGCRDVPAVRRRAVLALVAFDRPEADALIEELTRDHDWQVRQAAEELSDPGANVAGPEGPATDQPRLSE